MERLGPLCVPVYDGHEMVDRGLTERRRRFVQEYVLDLNATAAYRRAGYVARTDNAAAANGARLIRTDKVAAAIQTAQKAIAERNAVTLDEIVAGLRHEAHLKGKAAVHGARVAAWMGLAKVGGFITDKVESKNLQIIQDNPYLRELPLGQLLELQDAARKLLKVPGDA